MKGAHPAISRRDLLKWSAAAALGLAAEPVLSPVTSPVSAAARSLPFGRVIDDRISGYDRPSFTAQPIKSYFHDLVLDITAVTIGPDDRYNRTWYWVNNESYVYSGSIQPVEIRPNRVLEKLPETGTLAEVSVPFTDATWNQRRPDWVAYRLYYGTTHWLRVIVYDEQGEPWYRIADDKWDITYYVRAAHLRLITPDEVAPLSPEVPPDEKRLEVRLSEQIVVAYEYDAPVFCARMASGALFRDGDFRTPPGTYITNRKRPSRHMAAGDPAAPNAYDLPGIPWVTYLTLSGISFHGTFWHNDYGRPRSHGCINLTPADALWIYRWTNPAVPLTSETWEDKTGTRVDIID